MTKDQKGVESTPESPTRSQPIENEPAAAQLPWQQPTEAEQATVVIPAGKEAKPAAEATGFVPPAPPMPAAAQTSTVVPPPPRRVAPAAPQRISSATGSKPTTATSGTRRWLIGVGGAGLLVAVLLVGSVIKKQFIDESPQAQITKSINTFMGALADGDVATLRSVTTGTLSEFYQKIPDQQFADVYAATTQQKRIPTIASIDTVQITDRTAIAQLTITTADHPGEKSTRSINLQKTDNGWKVSNPPA